ncbi:MAG: SOS response-associated peptidase [Pseudomonadota bacterium]|nr:SOS response-associated peptidase [Pseudomonadota bacterium]
MVARFALTSPPALVRAYFGYPETPDFPPRAAILPTEPIAVVVAGAFSHGAARHFVLMRWGFLPGFVKDPATFPLLINARAESVLEKPSFRAAFKRRRCLIPADGFYVGARAKPALVVRAAEGGPLALAGLHETYLDASGGEIDTACILTTGAGAALRDVSERAPVVVPRAEIGVWLDHEAASLDAALALLRPAPAGLLRVTPLAGAADIDADTFR